jgi:cell division inhibitor SepF
MGTRDYWDRMLVYFGIAEEADEAPARTRSGGRRVDEAPGLDDDWDEPAARPAPRRGSGATGSRGASPRSVASGGGMGVVLPRTFNDAQVIADHVKHGQPVIVNLQQTGSDLAKRLIDFASGLTYGLDGDIKRIADKVFLLVPPNVEVSEEARAELVERGFFNQS